MQISKQISNFFLFLHSKASKQHRLKRYHSQRYVNGSKCDLNGNPRETEVRVRPCWHFMVFFFYSGNQGLWEKFVLKFLKKINFLNYSVLLVRFPVCLWGRLEWLHRSSGRTAVVPLRTDRSHQPHLSASIPATAYHCQTPGYRVPAGTERSTVHGLCQGSSVWVLRNTNSYMKP